MKILYALLLLLLAENAHSQSPQKVWEVFYDGLLTGKDIANAMVVDPEGNIYVTGRCYETASGGNFTTIKYDAIGGTQWYDHYNGTSANGTNRGIKLVMDKWDNVYAIGTVSSHQGDIAIVKYNAAGLVWSKSYEPYWFGSATDFGVDIAADTLGNIYAAGQITSLSGNLYDLYVMKCDSNGEKIYEDDYSSASGDDYTGGIAVTPSGNVFALTSSFNFFGTATYDITTINYLENGAHNWLTHYDGDGSATDYGTGIKVDAAGNQYVCGTSDEGLNNDMVAMKQNIYGTTLWSATSNGSANGNDTAITTVLLPNGFVAVTGRCRELVNGNTITGCVTLLIDSGNVLWSNKYYGSDNAGASPSQLITDEEGNLFICGSENLSAGTKNGYIIKYDLSGNLLWTVSFDSGNNLDDKFTSIARNNNEVIVTGQSFTSPANANYVTVKYGDVATGNTTVVPPPNQWQVYPNPVRAGEKIKLVSIINPGSGIAYSVYSLHGSLVESGYITDSFLLIGKNYSPGIYILQINSATNANQQKLLVTE